LHGGWWERERGGGAAKPGERVSEMYKIQRISDTFMSRSLTVAVAVTVVLVIVVVGGGVVVIVIVVILIIIIIIVSSRTGL